MANWQDAPIVGTGADAPTGTWQAAPEDHSYGMQALQAQYQASGQHGGGLPAGVAQVLPEAVRPYVAAAPQQSQAPQPPNSLASSLPGPLGQLQNTMSAEMQGELQGRTLNWGDELMASLMTPIQMAVDRTANPVQAYQTALSKERGIEANQRALNPSAADSGQLFGAIDTLGGRGGAGVLSKAAPTARSLIARGAVEGGIYGGVSGAGAGTDLKDKLVQGGQGAATGAAFGAGAGAAGKMFTGGAKPTIQSATDLQSAKDAAYAKVDQLGVRFSAQGYNDLVSKIAQDATNDNISAVRHPKAFSWLQQLRPAPGGTAPTLTQLDQMRQQVYRDLVAPGLRNPEHAAEAHFGQQIIDNIDNFIDGAKPAQIATGSGPQAAAAIRNARGANRQWRKMQTVDEALYNAQLNAASSGSGGNINNAVRQQFKSILKSPTKRRGFTALETQQMENIVKSSGGENAMRLAGKLSPSGNGLMAALGIGGTMANPVLGAVPLAATGAKYLADNATLAKVQKLRALISNGGKMYAPPPLTYGAKQLVGNTAAIGAAAQRQLLPLVPLASGTGQ